MLMRMWTYSHDNMRNISVIISLNANLRAYINSKTLSLLVVNDSGEGNRFYLHWVPLFLCFTTIATSLAHVSLVLFRLSPDVGILWKKNYKKRKSHFVIQKTSDIHHFVFTCNVTANSVSRFISSLSWFASLQKGTNWQL